MIQIEVWSDILCPFCYIGKRHLELALSQFEQGSQVKVIWRSFQLDPLAERDPGLNTYELLAKKYGQSLEQAKLMTEQVAKKAENIGLKFDFANAVMTNSYDAHRLIHLAAKYQLENKALELLFSAHFVEGKHIGDPAVLEQLGKEIGLNPNELASFLAGSDFAEEVQKDISAAKDLGVNGVPFFLFNQQYTLSGAQPVEIFLQAIKAIWEQRQHALKSAGNTKKCSADGCN